MRPDPQRKHSLRMSHCGSADSAHRWTNPGTCHQACTGFNSAPREKCSTCGICHRKITETGAQLILRHSTSSSNSANVDILGAGKHQSRLAQAAASDAISANNAPTGGPANAAFSKSYPEILIFVSDVTRVESQITHGIAKDKLRDSVQSVLQDDLSKTKYIRGKIGLQQ